MKRRMLALLLVLVLCLGLLPIGAMAAEEQAPVEMSLPAEALEDPAISADNLKFDNAEQSIGGWNFSGPTVTSTNTEITEGRNPTYFIELAYETEPDAEVTIEIKDLEKLLITDDKSKITAFPSNIAAMKPMISASNTIKKSGYKVKLSNGHGTATLYLVSQNKSQSDTFLQNTCTFIFTIAEPDTSKDPLPENVTKIAITTPPNKTEYLAGQSFSRTGMVVTATLTDGSKVPVLGYFISPSEALDKDVHEVTISFAGYTATQNVTVTPSAEINAIEITNGQLLTNQKWVWNGHPTETRTNEYHIVVHHGEEKGELELSIDPDTKISIDGVNQTVTSDGKCSLHLNTSVEGSSTLVALQSDSYTRNYTFVCYSQAFDGMPSYVSDYLCMASQYTNFNGSGPYGYNAVSTLRGVHINDTTTSSELTGPTSLGNWGGYIVYKYDEPIVDDPKNPYGIDFIVYGNSQDGAGGFAEPGQVYVSADGETWYPLAGSLYYDDGVTWNYSHTYTKEEGGGASGTRYSYPLEKYYPLFSWNDENRKGMTLTGVRLAKSNEVSEYGSTLPPFPAFGCVDVGPMYSDGSNVAGNPYTGFSLINRGGSELFSTDRPDGFDLKWAVDQNGLPVTFENGIQFVKIQTATLIDNSDIGEKSTEVHMMRTALPDATDVGKTDAPIEISVDGIPLQIKAGKDVYDAQVHGSFEVKVDAANGVNVYINSERTKAYTFADITAHKVIRVIVQEERKEPLIYYIKLTENSETERKPCSIISFNLTDEEDFKDRGDGSIVRAYNKDSTDRSFPEVLPREGYTFLGWKNALGKIYQEYSPDMPESMKLTAAWKPNNADTPSDPDDDVTVSFRLIGSTKSERDIDLSNGNYWSTEYVTWIATREVIVPGGSKVLAVLEKALAEAKLSYQKDGNYISAITSPSGVEMKEFTNGPRSGWMYTIDGKHAKLGIAEQTVSEGNQIIFHYVNDYAYEVADWDELGGAGYPAMEDSTYHNAWLQAEDTGSVSPGAPLKPEVGTDGGKVVVGIKPEAAANAKGEATAAVTDEDMAAAAELAKTEGADVIAIAPTVKGEAGTVSVELPGSSVERIAKQTAANVKVETGIADITLPQKSLEDLSKQSGKTVSVSVAAVPSTGAVKVEVAVDGKAVEKLSGGLAVATPAAQAKSGSVPVIVNDDGTETVIKKSVTEDGEVFALLDGPCTVKVIDNSKTFDDTAAHWGAPAIAFAGSHELFRGVSKTKFAPDAPMTRAMLVTVLYRLEDAVASGSNPFADVPADTWYTDAVIWANANGIVKGVSETNFAPNMEITREQMATMLYRYAKTLGMDTAASGELGQFSDGNKTSGWAVEAMRWAVGSGLISGRGNGVVDPTGSATRAEVATILQRMVRLMVK